MNEQHGKIKASVDVRSIRLQEHELISRPRIQSLLSKALQRTVTILKTPSGYGKTQAVLEIERLIDKPFLWFFGGRSERSLIDFYQMLLKQIPLSSQEDRGESALSLVREKGHIELLRLMKSAYPEGAYLVLDRVDSSPIRTDVERCIQKIIDEDEHRTKIVITTTSDPNISLAALARSRQLAMITKDQLAFTKDECGLLLRLHWNNEITDTLVDEITDFTDGWPQGIYALTQAFPSPPESLEILSESGMRSSFIPDEFARNELMVHGMDRELLLSMAFLPWFFPEDADKILGVAGTHARMKRIAESLPFITSGSMNRLYIDSHIRGTLMRRAREEWGEIRYKEHLREVARFLSIREEWFTALHYYLQIDDVESANSVLDKRNDAWVINRDPSEFNDIASHLSVSRATGSRGRFICALVSEMHGDFNGVLSQTDSLVDSDAGSSLVRTLRSRASRSESRSIQSKTKFSAEQPDIGDDPELRWWFAIRSVEDLLREGHFKMAESMLLEVSQMVRREHTGYAKQSHMFAQVLIQYMTGKYQSALATARKLLETIQDVKTYQLLRLYRLIAEIYGKTGELEKATLNERRALSLCVDLSSELYRVLSLLNLGLLDIHRGNLDQARGWLGEVESQVDRFETGFGIHQEFFVMRARLAWGAGAREEALEEFEKALALPAYSFFRYTWNRLNSAHIMLRSNDQERAGEVLNDILKKGSDLDTTHIVSNALLLLAYRSHLLDDESNEQIWLKKCWSMLDIHGYRFMPASDPEIVLWVESRRSEFESKRRSRGTLIAPSRKERTAKPKEKTVQAGSSWRYIQIHTLGPLRIATHGEIHEEIWKSRLKAKRFLEVLLSSETFRVSADEAAEYLWPDALPDKVRHRLHNEVSNLRKIFTKIGIEKHIEIKFEHSFYHLFLSDQVNVMHREFELLAQRGLDEFMDGMEESAYGFLKGAFDLYHGPFLKDAVYERFTDAYRQRLSELYSNVLRALAETSYLSSEESLSWWDRAIEHDPYDETAYKGAILMSIRSGHRSKAQRYFSALKERIVDELGLPLPEWCDEEEFEE